MRSLDVRCRRDLQTELPNLHQFSKGENGLKRAQRVYLHQASQDVSRECPVPRAEQPVELPGIYQRQRRKSHGTIHVYDNNAFCVIERARKGDSGPPASSSSFSTNSRSERERKATGCSPFGGNSSSETGSESWTSMTSGNGSTSPRRRIRVPTPAVNSRIRKGGEVKTATSKRSPRPPSSPRRVFMKIRLESDNLNMSKNEGDETGVENDAMIRPKTPALGKSRHFQATLQNIQEQCATEDSSDSSFNEFIAPTRVPLAPSRRRSMGEVVNDLDNGSGTIHGQTQSDRRMSMPVDLHELKKRIGGIRFINVREFSKDYIQKILSKRDKEETAGIASDEQRQRKCLSWLQSLEEAR